MIAMKKMERLLAGRQKSTINYMVIGAGFTNKGSYFAVEVKNYSGKFIELVRCKSPVSAKRWVSTHLM